jgi:hypothetical protein
LQAPGRGRNLVAWRPNGDGLHTRLVIAVWRAGRVGEAAGAAATSSVGDGRGAERHSIGRGKVSSSRAAVRQRCRGVVSPANLAWSSGCRPPAEPAMPVVAAANGARPATSCSAPRLATSIAFRLRSVVAMCGSRRAVCSVRAGIHASAYGAPANKLPEARRTSKTKQYVLPEAGGSAGCCRPLRICSTVRQR